jgi:predicted Zn-dependent protease
MKSFVALAMLAGCLPSATTPVNEQVMYGGVFKSSSMRLADEEFRAAELKQFRTPRAASEHSAAVGWGALQRGDLRTAIKRFNQCWLLDETNPTCFWGFGLFEAQSSRIDQALEHLQKAQSLMSAPPVDFQVDLATAYAQKAGESAKDPALAARFMEQANAMFERAAAAEPDNQKVPCVWARVLLMTDNRRRACQVVQRCTDDRDGVRKLLSCP